MDEMSNISNILSVLDGYEYDNSDDIIMLIAENFRKRRVEKNIARQRMAKLSGVPVSTLARFEQKGLIGFESTVTLAMAPAYPPEMKS